MFLFSGIRRLRIGTDSRFFADIRINKRYVISDNYLILSPGFHNGDDAGIVLERIVVCYAFILQLKTQSCDTV